MKKKRTANLISLMLVVAMVMISVFANTVHALPSTGATETSSVGSDSNTYQNPTSQVTGTGDDRFTVSDTTNIEYEVTSTNRGGGVGNFWLFWFLTEYEITVDTVGGGTVVSDDDDNIVLYSRDISFTIVPDEGCTLLSVLLDGVEVELSDLSLYTLKKVKQDHTLTFVFSEPETEEVEAEVEEVEESIDETAPIAE